MILLDERLAVLRSSRINSDHQLIADYEDLKARVERFLAAAEGFAVAKVEEAAVVKSNTSLTEGLKHIWSERHLQMADVGLLGVATLICQLADPLSVVVAGSIVGGKKVVDAIKAAAELAKANKKKD